MAVAIVALDGEKQFAGIERPRVDGNARHAFAGQRRTPGRSKARRARGRSTEIQSRWLPAPAPPEALPALRRGRKKAGPPGRRSGPFHGPCRRSAARRPARAWRRPARMASARSPISCAPGAAARMAARMLAASSLRGLSSVTMTTSAPSRGDLAHHRPLALITVAAAAKHHDQPVLREGFERRQRLFQRVGLVGVIDEHRRAIACRRQTRAAPARPADFPAPQKPASGDCQPPAPAPPRPARFRPGNVPASGSFTRKSRPS